MRTVLLHIHPLVAGEGYPIQLRENSQQSIDGIFPEQWNLPTPLPNAASAAVTPKDLADFLEATPVSPRFAEIGQLLIDLIMTTPAGKAWALLPLPVRTVLHVEDPNLQQLPWELMPGKNQPLFADLNRPMVRGTPSAAGIGAVAAPPPPPATPWEWPIRVLIIRGGGPAFAAGNGGAYFEKEVAAARRKVRSFGRPVELKVLDKPTTAALRQEVRAFQPHVFHFIGHSASLPGGPVLMIYNGAGNGGSNEELTVDYLKTLIADLTPAGKPPILRIAIINACRSAVAGGKGAATTSRAITDAFHASDVPAVIGMQADIREDAAADVTGPLYEAMASGQPAAQTLDIALARARGEIRIEPTRGPDFRDWCLPSLYLAVPAEDVLPMPVVSPQTVIKIAAIPEFKKIKGFVDRVEHRHELCLGLHSPDPNTSGLFVITGESQVGKTALLHYLLESYKMRGHKVAYVDMEGSNTCPLLKVLKWIRDGIPTHTSRLCVPDWEARHFNEFSHTLNHLQEMIDGKPLPPMVPAANGVVRDLSPEAWPSTDYLAANEVVSIFSRAMLAAAETRPTVLAINDPKISPDHFKEFIVPSLIAPIARRELDPVRMIMVIPQADERTYLQSLEGMYREIALGRLASAQWQEYAREFFSYEAFPVSPLTEGMIQIAAGSAKPWVPVLLKEVEAVVQRLSGGG